MNKRIFLLLPFIVVVIFSVGYVAYKSNNDARTLLMESVVKDYSSVLMDSQRDIRERIDRLIEIGVIMSDLPDVSTVLSSETPPEQRALATQRLQRELSHLAASTRLSKNLAVIGVDGELITDIFGNNAEGQDRPSPRMQALQQGRTLVDVSEKGMNGKPVLYVLVPVLEKGVVIGGCLVSMDMERLALSLAERTDKNTDTKMVLLDSSHRVIVSSTPNIPANSNYATPEHVAVLASLNSLVTTGVNGERIGMHAEVPGLDLGLVICANREKLMEPAEALWQRILLYSAGSGIGSIVIVFILLTIVLRRQESSDARLAQVVELAGLATWDMNTDKNKFTVNKYFNKLLGLPEEKAVYTEAWLMERLHPEDAGHFSMLVKDRDHDGPVPWSATFRILHEDGHWHWLESMGHITRWNSRGLAVCAMGMCLDVHAAKMEVLHGKAYQQELEATVERVNEESVAALRRERSLLSNVIDNIPDFIYFKDMSMKFMGANKAFLALFGNSLEKAGELQTELAVITSDQDPDALSLYEEQDEYVFLTGELLRVEEKVRLPDGRGVYLETFKTLMVDDGGNPIGIVCISRDITPRKEAEEAIVRAKEEATAASKAKSEFLANMSHEIRTPLNGILGLNYLALQGDLSDKQRNYLNKIEISAKTLLGIINDILDFSKIEAGRMELEWVPFAPREQLQATVDVLQSQARERGNTLELDIAPDVPQRIMGDPLRFGQVLLNLAGNAVKFTEKGVVRLVLRMEREGRLGEWLHVEVQDTGIGMDSKRVDSVFQPFVQADASTTRKYGGTGLGLAITRSLVEAMGAKLEVRSEPGQGSCFFFTMEVASLPETEVDELRDRAHGMRQDRPLEGKRILLVEDNDLNQLIAEEILTGMGCHVAVALNGREAVDMALAQEFDLVLMDIQMPVMDGLAATIELRAAGYTVPIIAMTANAMREDRDKALAVGMQDHVPKPFNVKDLEIVLCQWTRQPPSA